MSVSTLIFLELKNSQIEDMLKPHFFFPGKKELCTALDLNSKVSSTVADTTSFRTLLQYLGTEDQVWLWVRNGTVGKVFWTTLGYWWLGGFLHFFRCLSEVGFWFIMIGTLIMNKGKGYKLKKKSWRKERKQKNMGNSMKSRFQRWKFF